MSLPNTASGLDPSDHPPVSSHNIAIQALIGRLVKQRLEENELQLKAQIQAWNKHKASLKATIADLQGKLLGSSSDTSATPGTLADDDDKMADGTENAIAYGTASGTPTISRKVARRIRAHGLPTNPTRSSRPVLKAQAVARKPVTRSQSQGQNLVTGANPDTSAQHPPSPLRPGLRTRGQLTSPEKVQPKAEAAPPSKKKTRKRPVQKATAEIFRVLPDDLPSDIGGLKAAIALHIRVLWGLFDAKMVPKDPPQAVLFAFNKCFSTEEEMLLTCQSEKELIPRHLVQIGLAMSAVKTGRIAKQARLLEENMLSYIQARLSHLGLRCWCPDLRQSPYSIYNSACRIVALDTFKQSLVSHLYAHLGPNTAYASNTPLLIKLFDHFVFHYIYRLYQKEKCMPGSVEDDLNNNPQYQGRIRLAEARKKFLVQNNYPKRYHKMIDAKATSDDEHDVGQDVRIIKRRPERSAKAEAFFRLIDQKREEEARHDRSRRWRQRKRIFPSKPEDQENTTFHALADGMPIDYYDPTFFNKLQPRTRNRIAKASIALLEDVSQSFGGHADERLNDEDFTAKYGPAVFPLYNMVKDSDLAKSDSGEEWDDDLDEDVDMSISSGTSTADATETPDSISASRSNLVAHLSVSDINSTT